MANTAIYTIGYEGRAIDEFIAMLAAEQIERVIDVRDLPLSRRRGFSKTPLGEALRGAGIEYVHMKSAGNPYRKEKDQIPRDELLAKYGKHIAKSTTSSTMSSSKCAVNGSRCSATKRSPGNAIGRCSRRASLTSCA